MFQELGKDYTEVYPDAGHIVCCERLNDKGLAAKDI